ncbi:hypothetical protein Mpop_2730 [Methylorubrum populi BJ001]|jgi:hypothetical protein|uniref:Uncharacterized protein n=1 Tax=Methylorubrum populi (strain ATCC BAA-705 / NCIMB 13946 / BJ001) TaxID=441620 RepID=B1ZD16_METPB|nr:hypothetical protein [Methylorubrum populi]ACB80885.1 hypothetical protein Mpop_2730 [Methylorubrum populi BJ001]
MLTAADIGGFDLPALTRRLEAAALHQDRCRRRGAGFDLPKNFRATAIDVTAMDEHAASIAEGARFVALVHRLSLDDSTRRPAPVIRLVPAQEQPAAPAPKSPRLFSRALARLWPAREVA